MTLFLTLVSLLLLATSTLLGWQLLEQRKLIEHIQQDQGADINKTPELVLTLKVQNPLAIAKRESRAGRMLADRLPGMIRKVVYKEVMKELAKELKEREIEVEMNLEYR